MKAHALRALYGEKLVGRTVRDGEGNIGIVLQYETTWLGTEYSFFIATKYFNSVAVLKNEDVFLVPLHLLDRCAQIHWARRQR